MKTGVKERAAAVPVWNLESDPVLRREGIILV